MELGGVYGTFLVLNITNSLAEEGQSGKSRDMARQLRIKKLLASDLLSASLVQAFHMSCQHIIRVFCSKSVLCFIKQEFGVPRSMA